MGNQIRDTYHKIDPLSNMSFCDIMADIQVLTFKYLVLNFFHEFGLKGIPAWRIRFNESFNTVIRNQSSQLFSFEQQTRLNEDNKFNHQLHGVVSSHEARAPTTSRGGWL